MATATVACSAQTHFCYWNSSSRFRFPMQTFATTGLAQGTTQLGPGRPPSLAGSAAQPANPPRHGTSGLAPDCYIYHRAGRAEGRPADSSPLGGMWTPDGGALFPLCCSAYYHRSSLLELLPSTTHLASCRLSARQRACMHSQGAAPHYAPIVDCLCSQSAAHERGAGVEPAT